MTGENNGMFMPVVPQGFGGNGGDFLGGNGAWLILVLLALWWGNGNSGFGGGGNGSMQRGFDQSAVMNGLSGIQNAVCNGFQNAETAAAARQVADMNQIFGVQSSLQQCCCDQRAATADLKYTIATEAANTRANCNDNKQQILDKLCQLEMDGIRQNYEGQLRAMQNQINAMGAENQALKFAASQGAQTAQIMADNAAQTIALERYLSPTPIPAYVVQNPNCCQQPYGQCGGYAA